MYVTMKDIEMVESMLEHCPNHIYYINLEILNKLKEARKEQTRKEQRVIPEEGKLLASEEEINTNFQEKYYTKEEIEFPFYEDDDENEWMSADLSKGAYNES